MTRIPVLTIDGPSGSGKGTIARKIAGKLGWAYGAPGAQADPEDERVHAEDQD